ncbi:hypothetical protein GOBAR_DD08288 [Gossypium barbadense]|nr:hypothetical protein GOBAR_DD08288 [Gossypium barbadense]
MEVLDDDEDMSTVIAIYCSTKNFNVEPVELFTELVDVEPIENVTPINFSAPDLDEVSEDINDESAEEVGDVPPLRSGT